MRNSLRSIGTCVTRNFFSIIASVPSPNPMSRSTTTNFSISPRLSRKNKIKNKNNRTIIKKREKVFHQNVWPERRRRVGGEPLWLRYSFSAREFNVSLLGSIVTCPFFLFPPPILYTFNVFTFMNNQPSTRDEIRTADRSKRKMFIVDVRVGAVSRIGKMGLTSRRVTDFFFLCVWVRYHSWILEEHPSWSKQSKVTTFSLTWWGEGACNNNRRRAVPFFSLPPPIPSLWFLGPPNRNGTTTATMTTNKFIHHPELMDWKNRENSTKKKYIYRYQENVLPCSHQI